MLGTALDGGGVIQWGTLDGGAPIADGQVYAVQFDSTLTPSAVVPTAISGTAATSNGTSLFSVDDEVVAVRGFEVTRYTSDFATATREQFTGLSALLPTPTGVFGVFPGDRSQSTWPEQCALALGPDDYGMGAISKSGVCPKAIRVGQLGRDETTFRPFGPWSTPLIELRGDLRVQLESYTSALTFGWRSPELSFQGANPRNSHWARAGSASLGVVPTGSATSFIATFSDGAAVSCPTRSYVVVRLDASTGRPTWMHCLARGSTELHGVHVIDDRLVLVLQSATRSEFRLGRHAIQVAQNSPIFVVLRPP